MSNWAPSVPRHPIIYLTEPTDYDMKYSNEAQFIKNWIPTHTSKTRNSIHLSNKKLRDEQKSYEFFSSFAPNIHQVKLRG